MHVGMNRSGAGICDRGEGVPHARGDEPLFRDDDADSAVSSPCTWG